jgi:hypothetical protein
VTRHCRADAKLQGQLAGDYTQRSPARGTGRVCVYSLTPPRPAPQPTKLLARSQPSVRVCAAYS